MRLPARVVPLHSWQDPQADVLLRYSEDVCEVRFSCWGKDAQPAEYTGVLLFECARAVRSERSEFAPFDVPVHNVHSYILEVDDCSWVDAVRARNRKLYDVRSTVEAEPLRHFVVLGHGVYHEVLATGFSEQRALHNSPRNLAELPDAGDAGPT